MGSFPFVPAHNGMRVCSGTDDGALFYYFEGHSNCFAGSSVNELANVSWPDLFLASSQAGGSGGGRFSVPKWGQRQLAESQRARGGQSQAEARGHADAKRGALDAWCCCPVPRSSQLLHGKRVCFMLGFALTCRLSATIRDLPWDAAGTFDRWRVWLVGAEKAFGRVERPAESILSFVAGHGRRASPLIASFLSGCSDGLKEDESASLQVFGSVDRGEGVLADHP